MNKFKKFKYKGKKQTSILLVLSLLAASFHLALYKTRASEDYSNESEWMSRCTQAQSTSEEATACLGFQEYEMNKKEELSQELNTFNASIEGLKGNADAMEKAAQDKDQLQKALEEQIKLLGDTISTLDQSISNTQSNIDFYQQKIDAKQQEIEQKESEIDAWDNQIKARMKAQQAQSGTNQYIDLIMEAGSLADMMAVMSGIEKLNSNDRDQISQIEGLKTQIISQQNSLITEKEDLELTKSELDRLKAAAADQSEKLKAKNRDEQELEKSFEKLIEQYQQIQAKIADKLNSVQQNMEKLAPYIIPTGLSSELEYSAIPQSNKFLTPIKEFHRSAGTWYYDGGGLHLGMDFAAPIGSQVMAPMNGVVIYTSNSEPTDSGYLGNWSGWPYGSGNCIEMLGIVNGTTYAISFFHLSNEFYVSPGSIVTQGQVLCLSGNAGNSTGPHTHIEIYNLGKESMKEAIAYFQETGDTAFQTGWSDTSTACEFSRHAPCRVRPENVFEY